MLSYITASIWCAKLAGPDKSLWEVRLAIVIYTALALIGIGFIGWVGQSPAQLRPCFPAHDADTPEDRHRFLGFATLLLSGLSAVAVIYAALVVVFIGSCH